MKVSSCGIIVYKLWKTQTWIWRAEDFSSSVIILFCDEWLNWEVSKGFAPDVRKGRADEVVDQRPYHREAWLPRSVYYAVQDLLWIKKNWLLISTVFFLSGFGKFMYGKLLVAANLRMLVHQRLATFLIKCKIKSLSYSKNSAFLLDRSTLNLLVTATSFISLAGKYTYSQYL